MASGLLMGVRSVYRGHRISDTEKTWGVVSLLNCESRVNWGPNLCGWAQKSLPLLEQSLRLPLKPRTTSLTSNMSLSRLSRWCRLIASVVAIFSFFPASSLNVFADILITEFMADNRSTLLDEDGDDSDWIEIYNSGAAAISLSGYCLTDNSANLDKWVFPDVSLGAGEFAIVFASGKDRATAGGELHANFSLRATGEYLALVDPDRTTVLQEFAPEYSRHEPDESYGVPFDGVPLVTVGSAAHILVPSSGSLGTGWTLNGFNAGSWLSGDTGVGFGLSVPGFIVEEACSTGLIRNLSSADALLNGEGVLSQTTEVLPVVNFLDTGSDGRFGSNLVFPNGGGDDFALRASGTIEIPTTGTWTFGTTSDDGVRVRIDGANVINDDSLHAVQDRFGSRSLSAGAHTIELVFFERGGGADVELFAAQGNFSSFNCNFKLVGNTVAGGLAVSTSPEGGAAAGPIATNIESSMKGIRSSAYVRVPFSVANVGELESLSLSMRYNDGFVAYINGVEVARNGAPASPSWNSAATLSRTIDASLLAEGFNATTGLGSLVNGTNVLAIHGLNVSENDSTFLVAPELAGGGLGTGTPVYFVTPTPGAVNSQPASLGRVLDADLSPRRGAPACRYRLRWMQRSQLPRSSASAMS